MTQAQAIETLSAQYGAPYGGTFTAALSGNLIENIMMEDSIGKVFHRFGKNIVENSNLIALAQFHLSHWGII